MSQEWSRQVPEVYNGQYSMPPKDTRTASEIKRSSWNAGMAADMIQPPPGSPAAWQGRRHSRPPSSLIKSGSAIEESPFSPFSSELRNLPRRSASPTRGSQHLTVPSLQTIRSVSGSALGDAPDLQNIDHMNVLEEHTEHNHGHSHSHGHGHSHGHSHTHDSNDTSKTPASPSPFNFTPTFVTPGKSSIATRASQRRGHHYKHSSVSLNFFQEPEKRVPLSIPVSLAVPTLREYYQSITQPQFLRLAWCGLRMLVAASLYSVGSPLESVATLAHLLAYETIVSTSIACIEVLANFEVWSRSSLRLPFALKRVEVLVAFGLSAVLLFVGGDIVSHIIQSLATGGHNHGHHHDDAEVQGSLNSHQKFRHISLLTVSILSILPTAYKHGTGNPLAVSTLGISTVVLIVPFLPTSLRSFVDTILTPVIAFIMIFVGYTSSKLFSGMLAMSYGGPDRSEAITEMISSDPSVAQVSDISLWQVHHDLWLASMRITMSGDANDERRVREQAAKAVREAVDVKDVEWETTIEISRTEAD